MNHLIQNIFIFFGLIGIWHTIILILCNTQKKETFKIDVKPELAGILLLLAAVFLYSLFGEL